MAKKSSARTSSRKKTARKKAAASRAGSARKKTTKKTSAGRSPAKKAPARKSSAKKASSKKAAARKSGARKASGRKTTTKKSPAKKKKTTARKSSAKKAAAAKKPAVRKAPSKKTAKKTAAKKTAKKAAAPKAAAEKGAAEPAGSAKTSSKKKTTRKKSGGQAASSRRPGRSVAEVASSASADEKGYVFINGRRVRMISTKGRPIVKKSRAEAIAAAAEAAEEIEQKPVKTTLTRKELKHYRNLLLLKRAELVGDLSALETEALRSSGGDVSHMPIHMADIGSDTYEQDFMLGLAESERQRLREIDSALQRIEDGTYGVCQMTGQQIPTARLEAKPWAKYTIEAARQLERGWGV